MITESIAVVGLGYVGLPVALALARKFPGTIGYDSNKAKLDALAKGVDTNGEVSSEELENSGLRLVSDPAQLKDSSFFIIAVPTPVDKNNTPDLAAVLRATEMVGKVLTPASVVVYESTVYPGVTEDVCGPFLAKVSGLTRKDFKLGYSPERINPGDREHTLEKVVKIVSGEDETTLKRVSNVYGAIITAGIHKAPSIRVAEAAKVIENTQRDLNIALMNELAIIFDLMGIRTRDVLEAAGTKWNFLHFQPGLVGGHCIGVDPYYLTMKAQQLGYQPRVILAGRATNNGMGSYIAQRLVKLLIRADIPVKGARVGILGLTFKENCSDLRNSKVPDIIKELEQFGICPFVHDPLAPSEYAEREYGFSLAPLHWFKNLDALVYAVKHDEYQQDLNAFSSMVRKGGVLVDVKSAIPPQHIREDIHYWSL